jgi:transcriptional regulator with XRE-family HTH domain
MAKALEISSQTTYAEYENADRKMAHSTLIKLSELGFDLNWLITGKIIARISHRLSQLREKQGLTIEEFSAKLIKPISFVNAIETLDIMPSEQFLESAVKAFNETMDFYLPQNKGNIQQRNSEMLNALPQEFLEWLRTDADFKSDFDGLISRWRRIKTLEQQQR